MNTRRHPPPTERVFIAGNSGSGKTTLARKAYIDKAPRAIIVDLTGEWEGSTNATVYNVKDLAREIGYRANFHGNRWKIALSIDGNDYEIDELTNWLLPVPNLHRSPILAVGGATLLVDEVDLIAPTGFPRKTVRTLYRRTRHVGLSIVSTTQRPANVSREVSAQSTQAAAFALQEPRDVDYMAMLLGWGPEARRAFQKWTQRHPHGYYWRSFRSGRALWRAPGVTHPAREPALDAGL